MKFYVDDKGAEAVVISIPTKFTPIACFRITRCLESSFGAKFVNDSGNTLDWVRSLNLFGQEVMIGYDEYFAIGEVSLILPKILGADKIAEIQLELSCIRLWI